MTYQHDFQDALLDPNGDVPKGLAVRHGANLSNRFAVYRNNVFVSLIDALAETFPVTQSLVGEEFFRAMAREFVRHNPPGSPILTYYGETFSDFIENFSPADSVPYLSDIARLEYAYVVSFHARDAQPYPNDQISNLLFEPESIAKLCATLHPSAELVLSKYAIASIWEAHQHEDPNLKGIAISKPESAFIVRASFEVRVCRIDSATALFIQGLRDADTLGLSAEQASSADSTFDLTHALSLLIRTNAFIDISKWQGTPKHV